MSGMAGLLREALSAIAAMGAAGGAAFVLLYAACCLACVPASILTFGAGAAFGLGYGFALVWVGAMLGACASFWAGRRWLRGWVERRIARYPAFLAIDAVVSVDGPRMVFLTRLTPIFPFAFLNYAFGLTRVRFRDYALASGAGMVPGMLLFVYLGAAAGEAARGSGRTAAELSLIHI